MPVIDKKLVMCNELRETVFDHMNNSLEGSALGDWFLW